MTIDEKCENIEIKSPITGIFHDAPINVFNKQKKPKPETYVKIGSHIIPEVIVCDVEAMRVRIPVEAGVYGTIKEKLVNTGDFVEYNQVLFKIALNK